MYVGFTDRARKVMQLANQEAQRFNHKQVSSAHVLLGLIKEGSGVAANVLTGMGVDLQKVRVQIEQIQPTGPDVVVMSKLPHTLDTKRLVEKAIASATMLGHDYVGTEHLLMGLLADDFGSSGVYVLHSLGLDQQTIRAEVLMHLKTAGESGDASKPPSTVRELFGVPAIASDITEAGTRTMAVAVEKAILKTPISELQADALPGAKWENVAETMIVKELIFQVPENMLPLTVEEMAAFRKDLEEMNRKTLAERVEFGPLAACSVGKPVGGIELGEAEQAELNKLMAESDCRDAVAALEQRIAALEDVVCRHEKTIDDLRERVAALEAAKASGGNRGREFL